MAALNIIMEMARRNTRVSLFPISEPSYWNSEQERLTIQQCCENRLFFDHYAPCLRIWHQHDLAQKVTKGMYAAMPFFELDDFRDISKHHLSYPDVLLASSTWAQNVLMDHVDSVPVHVVPLGVDTNTFNPSVNVEPVYTLLPSGRNPYIFMNAGKWEYRKGHDILIEAFNKAFNENDDVELWLLPNNPFLSAEDTISWEKLYWDSKMGKHIQIFPGQHTHTGVANLMSNADCGVFPSRAEGWNLEALEMMAMDKPIIITDCTAHTEFCNDENSLLIPIDEYEDAYDGIWFDGTHGRWAELGEHQLDMLIAHMRNAYTTRLRGNGKQLETAKKFSWANTVNKIEEVF